MSSTDRTLWGQGPCPCGEGQIAVYRCVPDHPWPTASVLNEHNLSGTAWCLAFRDAATCCGYWSNDKRLYFDHSSDR